MRLPDHAIVPRDQVAAWLTSLVLHAALLVALGLVVFARPPGSWRAGLVASTDAPPTDPITLADAPLQAGVRFNRDLEPHAVVADPVRGQLRGPRFDLPKALRRETALGVGPRERTMPIRLALGGGLEGRRAGARGRLVNEGGGSAGSEEAVARGLRWLMAHQLDDGCWRFDLRQAPQCRGYCRDHGTIGCSTASTALALLPYLGAGATHVDGDYQQVVSDGIYYLMSRMHATPQGGDLQEGTMYAQGLSAIVLCEAFAMTGDASLRPAAQSAIDFIVAAQHPGGGWRYGPGQPGDTTVTGWQVMALKSAQLAGLEVPMATWYAVARFLDQVQMPGGVFYGYQYPERRTTTTSIGLLCRMYLGWPRDHEPLAHGVAFLSEEGPSPNNMYFNFYASQVLHHYQGPDWDRWNVKLRDQLIRTQASEGHESGSWQFDEGHSQQAGRLYNTTMAIMTLEIYYRYLPLYGDSATGAHP